MSEVYVTHSSYAGVHNDLKKDWDPHMTAMGYKRKTSNTNTGDNNEDDAVFVRIGVEEA